MLKHKHWNICHLLHFCVVSTPGHTWLLHSHLREHRSVQSFFRFYFSHRHHSLLMRLCSFPTCFCYINKLMKVCSCCGKSGLQWYEPKSMVFVLCFLEGTHLQTTAIQYLSRETGACAAALFNVSSSGVQRGSRAAAPGRTWASSCKQQTSLASIHRLWDPEIDTGMQVLGSMHLPVTALRAMTLNTAWQRVHMLKTHTRWTEPMLTIHSTRKTKMSSKYDIEQFHTILYHSKKCTKKPTKLRTADRKI